MTLLFINFKVTFICVSMYVHTQVRGHFTRFILFYHVGPGIELRSSGSQASSHTYWAISPDLGSASLKSSVP